MIVFDRNDAPSDLDRVVAGNLNYIMGLAKEAGGRSKIAIFADQLRQLVAISILENDLKGRVSWDNRVSLAAAELVRLTIDDSEKIAGIPDLERAAETDVLTGLMNRRTAELLMVNMIEHFDRLDDGGIAYIIFDANAFKSINDQLGHASGDYVLKIIASVLRSHARPYDVVARWGGEEFLLVIEDEALNREVVEANWGKQSMSTREDGIGKVISEIQYSIIAQLQELNPGFFTSEQGFIPGTLSLGWGYLDKRTFQTLKSLGTKGIIDLMIGEADRFMYHNKRILKGEVVNEVQN